MIKYNLMKNELMNTFGITETKYRLSQDKNNYLKKDYENKDKEYIEKFSYYQKIINPSLLVPIREKIINKSKKNLNFSSGDIITDYNEKSRNKIKYKTLDEDLFKTKTGKIKLKSNSSKNISKKGSNKYISNNAISTSTTISIGNTFLNIGDKILKPINKKPFQFNKNK